MEGGIRTVISSGTLIPTYYGNIPVLHCIGPTVVWDSANHDCFHRSTPSFANSAKCLRHLLDKAITSRFQDAK